MFDSTQFSRRRLLKIGAVGAVGVGALGVPLGRAAAGKQASRLSSANIPEAVPGRVPAAAGAAADLVRCGR